MDYRIDKENVVVMSGRFTFADNARFAKLLAELRLGGGSWVFDMAGVEFVDSSAMGMLLMANDTLKEAGGVSVRGVAGQVRRTFELARLGQVMRLELA